MKLLAIMLLMVFAGCSTLQVNDTCPKYAPPVKPTIEWQEDKGRASLSLDEAVALLKYLMEVDGYIEKTQ